MPRFGESDHRRQPQRGGRGRGESGNTNSLGNGAETVSATGGDNVVSVGNGRDSISVEGHGQVQLGLSQAAQLPSRHKKSDISCLKRAYGLARCIWRGLDHFRAYVWSSVVAYNLALFARLSRPKSLLRPALATPAHPGSISHSNFAPSRQDQPSQSPDGLKRRCKQLSFGSNTA